MIYRSDGTVYKEDCGTAVLRGFPRTNNVAEYCALGFGLKGILDSGYRHDVKVYGDSKLVINQVFGSWNTKAPHIYKLLQRIRQRIKQLPGKVTGEWVPRDKNAYADSLSKKAYFEATGQHAPERHIYGKP